MDENEKLYRTGDFQLDDILKEFAEPEPDVRIWGQEDTLRLDDLPKENPETPAEAVGDTVRFTPLSDEEVTVYEPHIPQHEPETEPFSDNWEPEYDDPISDYVPPEPIVFRPKNRLHELKKKLVEGPERRYYELEEVGIGRLQLAIFLSFLVSLAAVAATVVYQLGWVGEAYTRLMVFCQVFFLLASALLGSYQLLDGLGSLFRGRFTPNTLLVFSLIGCAIDGVFCLRQMRLPGCALFCIHMTLSLTSTFHSRSTEMAQMDTLRKATRLNGLTLCRDYFQDKPGFLRCDGQVEDFMDHYDAPSGPEKVRSFYCLAVLLAGIGCGVAAGMLYGISQGLQIFSTTLLVALPVGAHIALSRPMALLQRRLKKHGSVICGWQGVRDLCREGSFPLADGDLFPLGSAKLNGVKFYGARDPDQVVAYAAAIIGTDGGTMAPLVTQLLESRSGYHYDADKLKSYPGGIGGIVDGEAVLAGTLTFMQNMGVEMPKGTKVSQAVYVAIDGQLCGVFAVTFNKVKSSAVGLTTLCSYRRLRPVMVTGDFMLTESFLHSKFGVNTKRILFPNRAERAELAQKTPDEGAVSLAMTTQEGLAGFAYTVTGSRALRSSSIAGTVVYMVGGILGMAVVAALVAVNALYLLSPVNVLLYQLIWLLPGWLITEWTRSV